MPVRNFEVADAAERIAAAAQALKAAADAGGDRIDASDVRAQLDGLESAMAALRALLDLSAPAGAAAAPPAARAAAARDVAARDADDAPPRAGERREFDLAGFFSSVADSLVDAQRQLDAKSREYLEEQRRAAELDGFRPPPSVFRIPKVTADLKFAMETQKSDRVGLVFFSRSDLAKTLHQQSMQLEVVAVPPTPEVAAQVASASPRAALLLDPQARERLFARLREAELAPTVKREPLLERPDHVLVFPLDDRGRGYLLAYAGDDQDKHLGVWNLAIADDGAARLSAAYKYDLAPRRNEDTAALKALVQTLGERQAALLAGVR